MKKILIKAAILLCVFIGAIIITSLLMKNESTTNLSDFGTPTLPVVMIEDEGVSFNQMFGYTTQMDVDGTRDSLTPLDTDRNLEICIQPYDNTIQSMTYEIRTSDGSKVLENKTIKDFTQNDGYYRTTINIQCEMLMNQEYSLQLKLEYASGSAYYYTRVIMRTDINTQQYLAFVQQFAKSSLSKESEDSVAAYLEPDDTASNSSFLDINIHSSSDMVTWADLEPQMSRQGVPVIKDINETTGSVSLEYQITAKDADGNEELYNVTEFYRMRYVNGAIALLDFERSARQVFDPEGPVITSEAVQLGVISKEVQYMSDATAQVLAFVQEGELWTYSRSMKRMTRIFSFRDITNTDIRGDNTNHKIHIVRVDSSGDMDFIVYGYMNSGAHEGQVGIAAYHYYSSQNALKEQAFIPSTSSDEFLNLDADLLTYTNQNGQMFVYRNDTLYQIDMESGTYETVVEGVPKENFMVSKSNASAVWKTGGSDDTATVLVQMDFETVTTRNIVAPDGYQIQAIGYMNEDFVYGLARTEVVSDPTGGGVFAMDLLRIINTEQEVLKEYSAQGRYITSVTIGTSVMQLDLSVKDATGYVYQASDTIMNNKSSDTETVSVNPSYSSRRGTTIRLAFESSKIDTSADIIYSKIRLNTLNHEVELPQEESQQTSYYVYARGGLAGVVDNVSGAIALADGITGVVLNQSQQYVWERGNVKTQIELRMEDIPEIFRSGTMDMEQLQEAVGDTADVLDLTGSTLEQILYFISTQRAVLAKTPEGSVLLIGYNSNSIIWYDPLSAQATLHTREESNQIFSSQGNVFISYIETLDER
ncbi:MAG: hypothetical protein ACK5MN_01230 [Lachnospiraceae bacterium]